MNTDIALELESNAINRWKCEKISKLQAVIFSKLRQMLQESNKISAKYRYGSTRKQEM